MKNKKKTIQSSKNEKVTEARWCYLMITLPLIGFIVFNIYPIIWSYRWSLFSYNGNASEASYVGLRNFVNLFTVDHTYWKLWINTIIFALCKIPLELALALLLAILMNNERIKGVGFFRASFYAPSIISMAIVAVVFTNIFSYFGVFNIILQRLGLISENVDWFSSTLSARVMIVMISIWTTFGINVMYFISALVNVPKDLYESAEIDGATGWRKFTSITVPMIMPVGRTVLLLSLVGTLSDGGLQLLLTNGAPAGTTHTVMSYMTSTFVPGFADGTPAVGYGCAMAVITSIIFLLIGVGHEKMKKYLQDAYI